MRVKPSPKPAQILAPPSTPLSANEEHHLRFRERSLEVTSAPSCLPPTLSRAVTLPHAAHRGLSVCRSTQLLWPLLFGKLLKNFLGGTRIGNPQHLLITSSFSVFRPNAHPAASALLQASPGLSQKPEDPRVLILSCSESDYFCRDLLPALSLPTPTCYSDEILRMGTSGVTPLFPLSSAVSLPPSLRHHCSSSAACFSVPVPLHLLYPSVLQRAGEPSRDKQSAASSPGPPNQSAAVLTPHARTVTRSSLLLHSAAGGLRMQASVRKHNWHCSIPFSQEPYLTL